MLSVQASKCITVKIPEENCQITAIFAPASHVANFLQFSGCCREEPLPKSFAQAATSQSISGGAEWGWVGL